MTEMLINHMCRVPFRTDTPFSPYNIISEEERGVSAAGGKLQRLRESSQNLWLDIVLGPRHLNGTAQPTKCAIRKR